MNAQILEDTVTLSLIKSGIDHIYNLKFDKAEEIYTEISGMYRNHPVAFLYHGIMIYWQNYPLVSTSPSRTIFEEDMRTCITLSEMKPYSEKYEAEAILANLCARGLLLVFYADNDLSKNVFPIAAGAYKYIMRSFEFNTVYADLYYFTGLYNYYRDAYPRIHPVYKPVAMLFPRGDMQKGLKELDICAHESIVLRAESHAILSWIYTGFENNYSAALSYSGDLHDKQPYNLYFKALHIKNLLLLQKYDEAERYLDISPEESGNTYYRAQVNVFNAIIQEKKYRNTGLAKDLYVKGISGLSASGDYGNEYSAYAYFGLSRISEASGDKAGRRLYHRKAMDLADFKDITFD